MTFKEARIAAKVSQGELAKRLNVQQSAVSHWDNELYAPTRKYRPQIARIFGVKESDIEWRP